MREVIVCVILISLFTIISIGFSINASAQQSSSIPSWIKNNAKWWSEGNIGDSDFTKGIEWLVQNKIIVVSPVNVTSSNSQIPSWIKNNAKWWSEGTIGDSDFIKGIEYLTQNGIIQLHTKTQLTSQPATSMISQPVSDSTQTVFPQQTELGSDWKIGNFTDEKDQSNGILASWGQSFTNTNDGKKIHVDIAQYQSSSIPQSIYKEDAYVSNAIAITPDESIKNNCWVGDIPNGSNGPLSTLLICQKGNFIMDANPFGTDNSDQVKQDLTKLAQIILNKMPNGTSAQSELTNMEKLGLVTKPLTEIMPQIQDVGTVWQNLGSSNNQFNPQEYSYTTGLGMVATNNAQIETTIQISTGYQEGIVNKYLQHRDSGGVVMVWVAVYRFNSTNNAESYYKYFTNLILNTGGFQEYDTNTIGAQCYGIYQNTDVAEWINIYCTKDNIYYHVIGSSDQMLFDEDKQAINKFAQIVANNT